MFVMIKEQKNIVSGSNQRYMRLTAMPVPSRKKLLVQAENIHSKALEITLNTVGVQTLLSAKSYSNLGQIYQSQKKYEVTFILVLYFNY